MILKQKKKTCIDLQHIDIICSLVLHLQQAVRQSLGASFVTTRLRTKTAMGLR